MRQRAPESVGGGSSGRLRHADDEAEGLDALDVDALALDSPLVEPAAVEMLGREPEADD